MGQKQHNSLAELQNRHPGHHAVAVLRYEIKGHVDHDGVVVHAKQLSVNFYRSLVVFHLALGMR